MDGPVVLTELHAIFKAQMCTLRRVTNVVVLFGMNSELFHVLEYFIFRQVHALLASFSRPLSKLLTHVTEVVVLPIVYV